ncbi:D-alanine--D-alanyl carrier protein ligase [Streptomyces californicus]
MGDRALTYRESPDFAAKGRLRRAAGLRSDRERELRIGVVAHRSLPVYPVLLGVLAAGGSYVPLDPAAPVRRLREVARRAELAAVVTDAEGWAGLGLSEIAGLLVDRALPFQRGRLGGGTLTEFEALPEADGALPGTGRPGGPRPDDVAYTVFTSGSTGAPKGVLVEHRSAVNLARWVAGTTDLGPEAGSPRTPPCTSTPPSSRSSPPGRPERPCCPCPRPCGSTARGCTAGSPNRA